MPSDTRNAARSGAFSLFGSVISAVAGLLLVLVLGRAYGAAGAGVVLQTVAAFSIALGLARGGLDTTAVWLLPRLREQAVDHIRPALSAMLGASLVLGVVAGAGMAGLGLWQRSRHPELGDAVLGVAAFLPAAGVMTVGLAATRGLGGVRSYILISSILVPGVRPLLVLAVALAGMGTLAGAVSWAVPFPIAAVAALTILVRQVRRHEKGVVAQVDYRPTADLWRRISKFTLPRAVAAVLEQLMLWIDVILVGVLAGPAAAGVYGAATRFVNAGRIVSTALRIVVAPTYSRLLAEQAVSRVQVLYSATTQWIVLFSAPVYVLLGAFGGTLLSILGSEFASGARALLILSLGVLVSLIGGNLQALLLMSGHSGWAAVDKLVSLVVLVLGICVLTPIAGVEGAALGWCMAMIVDVGLGAFQVQRLVGVRVGGRPVLVALGVACLVPALPIMLARLLLGDTLIGLVWGAGAGALCWLAATLLLRRPLNLQDALALLRRD